MKKKIESIYQLHTTSYAEYIFPENEIFKLLKNLTNTIINLVVYNIKCYTQFEKK